MKVVIVGPGAMGLLLAGLFSKSREEIWLLDKSQKRARRLERNGITLKGLTSLKIRHPRLTADPGSLKDADFWIICVKSYATENVARVLSGVVAPEAFVLSLQNGVGHLESLAEELGARRVLAGVTHLGATLLSEGVVRHAGRGETVIGRFDGQGDLGLENVRGLFQRSKLALKISEDVRGLLWSKLVINVGINALSAITRLKNGRLIQLPWPRQFLREAVKEAVGVAKKKRIKLSYENCLARVEAVCQATSDNASSMLQDVLNKRKTEVEFLNGVIVREGERLGIKTPVNRLLMDLVKTLESSYSCEA
jgi:2-dehydropantoate 2-reductase